MVIGSSPSKEQLGGIRDPLLLETTVFFSSFFAFKTKRGGTHSLIADPELQLIWIAVDAAGNVVVCGAAAFLGVGDRSGMLVRIDGRPID